jgi:F-type H+-transporting ATPase subunit delta
MATVTNTYARAFVDVVIDGKLDAAKTLAEAQSIAALVASNKDLRQVWEAPSIPQDQKRKLLDAIVAKEKISREVRNFVAVLIDHKRTTFLGAIVKQFEQDLNQRLGFAVAEVTSARNLNDGEKRTLESEVETLTGKKVRANYAQDASILGGAVIRIGSTIYDGSVKGQLERMKQTLSSGA